MLMWHADVAPGWSVFRLEGAVELERFLAACHGSVPNAVNRLADHMAWRNEFLFFSPGQLAQEWGTYLHWHGQDVANRPILLVHLGKAAYDLDRNERSEFVRALGKYPHNHPHNSPPPQSPRFPSSRLASPGYPSHSPSPPIPFPVSQMEHGVAELAAPARSVEQGRVTCVVDCDGCGLWSLPLPLLKECALMLQTHFPMRLAVMHVLHVPGLLRTLAKAVMQVGVDIISI